MYSIDKYFLISIQLKDHNTIVEMKTLKTSDNINIWQRIHGYLLPKDTDVGYMPYVWLGYLLMYFVSFFFMPVSYKQWLYSVVGIIVFLVLYFRTYWVSVSHLYYYIGAIWLIGFVLAGEKMPGSGVFYVYACAFCAHFNQAKKGLMVLLLIIVVTIITGWSFDISPYIYLASTFFGFLIGLSNIYMSEMTKKNQQIKASQEELQKIAASAERERIARDLHDLVGHTFSAINIKSQLASKLMITDPSQAQQEIAEIESISRESLTQVREAVTGYRKRDLETELTRARILLNSLGIDVDQQLHSIGERLDEERNTALAYIVRELTTNIMRHAKHVTHCDMSLCLGVSELSLEIHDNGVCSGIKEGSGLLGIRERVENLGGTFEYRYSDGFLANIRVPIL